MCLSINCPSSLGPSPVYHWSDMALTRHTEDSSKVTTLSQLAAGIPRRQRCYRRGQPSTKRKCNSYARLAHQGCFPSYQRIATRQGHTAGMQQHTTAATQVRLGGYSIYQRRTHKPNKQNPFESTRILPRSFPSESLVYFAPNWLTEDNAKYSPCAKATTAERRPQPNTCLLTQLK
jgi:hypothetical protein